MKTQSPLTLPARRLLHGLMTALTPAVAVNADASPRSGQLTPVVLIHGIDFDSRIFERMKPALATAGFDVHTLDLLPNDGRHGIDKLACQVRDYIDQHLPSSRPLSIVGFSMGGIVGRYYLQRLAQKSRIKTFISVSSPHRGTWLAYLRWNEGGRQMRPGSAFLRALDADATEHQATRWITIRTKLDLTIVPSHSSSLPWAENHARTVLLHPLMTYDREVIRLIAESL
jgi:triacylglycerol lipase